ncbi:MAG: glycopeptide antibiotics resistance protein [Planctomycetota bacterium]|nr:glycopeptide antibiotics resistance protein [Planctomycetota bacterium]
MKRVIAAVLLGIYLIVLLDLTLFQFPQPGAHANFVPFRSISRDLRHGGWEMIINFVGNLAVFLPLGLLPPTLSRRWCSPLRIALISLFLSALIESLQYLSGRRVADVDDLILNVLGGLLGYGVWIAMERLMLRPGARLS